MHTVSIIIPVYNNENTIVETIASVLNQTYKAIEIIIVNDGSNDASVKVIQNYIAENNLTNITLLEQPNGGPSKARNNGAINAKGSFIVFLDGDDKLEPTYVEKAINCFAKNSSLNIVYAETAFFGAEEGVWNLKPYTIQNFLKNNCIPIFAMIKKEVFINVGMFDENLKFSEDWELWIRIIKQYNGVYKIPEVLFYYRKRNDNSSLSDNMNVNNQADLTRLYIFQKHYDFYTENNLSLTELVNDSIELHYFRKKYYSIWYKKIFYKLKNKS